MEPKAFETGKSIADQTNVDTVNSVAVVSIAISLKRIADTICGDAEHTDLVNHLGNVLLDAIHNLKA